MLEISFTRSGRFQSTGAFLSSDQSVSTSNTCEGVAQAGGGQIRLQPNTSGCAARTASYVLDGNVLTLGQTQYFRDDIAPNSKSCLYGPWTLSDSSVDANAANWGSSGTVTLEYLYDGQHSVVTLHFGTDGSSAMHASNYAVQLNGAAVQMSVVMDGSATSRYAVSGSKITYSSAKGSFHYTFYYDRQVVNEATSKANNDPDSFRCDRKYLTISGAGYESRYYRGTLG